MGLYRNTLLFAFPAHFPVLSMSPLRFFSGSPYNPYSPGLAYSFELSLRLEISSYHGIVDLLVPEDIVQLNFSSLVTRGTRMSSPSPPNTRPEYILFRGVGVSFINQLVVCEERKMQNGQ